MKKVFLIGDSIRYGAHGKREIGYGYYVPELLKDKAEVFQPDDNCRFVQYSLRYLHDWAKNLNVGEDVDVVFWNNGLWEIVRILGDEPLIPVEQYGEMLVRLKKRINTVFPNAKIIFALTTPVLEELFGKDFLRRNSDIEKYNKTAIEVLEPLDVKICDLYSTAKPILPKHHSDGVHYDEIGASMLAQTVAEAITELL